MITLADLAGIESAAVEALLDAAFGPDRHGRTAYKLRAGTVAIPHLSIAASHAGRLVGIVQCWPVELVRDAPSAPPAPLVLVGPVAVLPMLQRDGIGRMLMTDLLVRARAAGAPPMMLIGDPEYYGRFFGFTAEATAGWRLPGPVERRRLLARAGAGQALPGAGRLQARLPVVA